MARFTEDEASERATAAWLLVAGVVVVFGGGCGRVAETPSASGEGDADASSPARILPDEPSTGGAGDGGGGIRGIGCAISPRPRAASIDGGASLTTFLELRSDGDAGAADTSHSPYQAGAFADGASAHRPSDVCGDRGVYFADLGCGPIALAACAEQGDAGAARSCIYVETNTHLRADEALTTPAGHFVDDAGRCWELRAASVALADDGIALGGSQAGKFEAVAVSGVDERRLSGSFVACRAVASDHTCR